MASERAARPRAPPFIDPPGYARHRPEATLRYELVERHYPVLPAKPIRQWVLSLPFALRFLLATDPGALTEVLGIVYRTISAQITKKARLTRARGATGAVTLIQRFGSALNLNIYFHMLVLDGAYLVGTKPPVFRRIEPPAPGGTASARRARGRTYRPHVATRLATTARDSTRLEFPS